MNSEEFRAIREALWLTQSELGKIMGISQHHLSDIETGKHKPTKIQAAFIQHLAECRNICQQREQSETSPHIPARSRK
ncbi:MAG: helix-turn-helix domain-containing protein [Desulfobulbus sp.]|nr:helix-turn-helix domain-containing protein [Desulfobulbus sp.]